MRVRTLIVPITELEDEIRVMPEEQQQGFCIEAMALILLQYSPQEVEDPPVSPAESLPRASDIWRTRRPDPATAPLVIIC